MGEGLNTLHDFLFQTKGLLYLLSVGYLVAFVCFWKFLHEGEKEE